MIQQFATHSQRQISRRNPICARAEKRNKQVHIFIFFGFGSIRVSHISTGDVRVFEPQFGLCLSQFSTTTCAHWMSREKAQVIAYILS